MLWVASLSLGEVESASVVRDFRVTLVGLFWVIQTSSKVFPHTGCPFLNLSLFVLWISAQFKGLLPPERTSQLILSYRTVQLEPFKEGMPTPQISKFNQQGVMLRAITQQYDGDTFLIRHHDFAVLLYYTGNLGASFWLSSRSHKSALWFTFCSVTTISEMLL